MKGAFKMRYIKRLAEERFLRMSGAFPAVLVCGARQTGKTTMLKHLAEDQHRSYVTLDDLNSRDLAKNDPELFFQTHRPPVIIDEVQYAPELFAQIKLMCDRGCAPGDFWMTGSQRFEMMKGVSESLAGRVGIMEMFSLTRSEIQETSRSSALSVELEALKKRESESQPAGICDLFDSIYAGGLPGTLPLDDELRRDYFYSYINTYVMRDVMELGRAYDVISFNRFIRACAANIGTQVNFATLADSAGISQPTAKEWLNLLAGMQIVYFVEPYFNNQLKRLVKAPKLYFFDTGVCAWLSKWPSADTLRESYVSGRYFENYVMNELIKGFYYSSASPNVYYYRDTEKNEIDAVLEGPDSITPLEIKMSANPGAEAVRNFSLLKGLNKKTASGGVVCMAEHVTPLDRNNILIPAWVL
jgi:predicted AAA+ superfamily ATPase